MNIAQYDILVIGGGNAGICAAITAAEQGKSVALLEAAPKNMRGGNSRHTRNFRVKHNNPLGTLEDAYLEGEYLDDLLKVTGGNTDIALAKTVIEQSEDCYHWMVKHNIKFQPSLSGSLSLSRTNAFFLGGGKALLNAYYHYAKRLKIAVFYEAEVLHMALQGQEVTAIDIAYKNTIHTCTPNAVIVTAGGFESNKEWLREYWGEAANNFIIRGTPYNKGKVLKTLIEQDITTVSDGNQCHAVAVDGQAPEYDGGIATRLDCVPFSVVLNKNGARFYNEGEDLWPKRYAVWGRLIAQQPEQIAYAVIDSKAINLFMTPLFDPIKADTLEELAAKLQLPKDNFMQEMNNFNQACGDESSFDPMILDNVQTQNLAINKTNWARQITKPPFYGFILKTGITFTYLGLKVDGNGQCYNKNGAIDNLWAAGEIMAGSILTQGYLAGFGMSIGTVFGRITGKKAADYVR